MTTLSSSQSRPPRAMQENLGALKIRLPRSSSPSSTESSHRRGTAATRDDLTAEETVSHAVLLAATRLACWDHGLTATRAVTARGSLTGRSSQHYREYKRPTHATPAWDELPKFGADEKGWSAKSFRSIIPSSGCPPPHFQFSRDMNTYVSIVHRKSEIGRRRIWRSLAAVLTPEGGGISCSPAVGLAVALLNVARTTANYRKLTP